MKRKRKLRKIRGKREEGQAKWRVEKRMGSEGKVEVSMFGKERNRTKRNYG